MLTRIVQLNFKNSFTKEFEEKFPSIKKIVESQKGCIEVKLFRVENGIYFTISKWENEEFLNRYRESSVFREIWTLFKSNFKDKANAWSTYEII